MIQSWKWTTVSLLSWLSIAGVANAERATLIVTALGYGDDPIQQTVDIRRQFVDFEEVDGLEVGAELEAGELLTSRDEQIYLELSCPEGSQLDFHGTFAVLINAPEDGVDCAVDLRAGKLDVITDGGTEIQSGDVTLGSEGTRYAVRIGAESMAVERVLVFEGAVAVETPSVVGQLPAGKAIDVETADGDVQMAGITEAEFDRWARLYARFNTIQARAAGADPDFDTLVRLHARVLRQPDDQEARSALATAQGSYGLAEASYHQQRTVESPDRPEPPKSDDRPSSDFDCEAELKYWLATSGSAIYTACQDPRTAANSRVCECLETNPP